MKELSIEEKAKAYDEAIKVAKGNYETIVQMDNDCTFAKEGIVNTFHHIFPELKESEDERMVKFIKKQLFNIKKTITENYELDAKLTKAIDWLEKQGEHAKFRESIQIGDKVTRNEDGVLVNLSQLNRVAKKDEKQAEQKPAWSEDDEVMIKVFDSIIRYIVEVVDKDALKRFGTKREELFSWLKSLKDRVQPQSQWKPSDEQMTALRRIKAAIAGEGEIYKPLNSLYEDLRKLREE